MGAVALVLAALPPAAQAGTVSYDGAAIVFTGGDNLHHDVQFRYDEVFPGRDQVLDVQAITSFPAGCQYENGSSSWISCPPHTDVRVDLGAGDDNVNFARATASTATS